MIHQTVGVKLRSLSIKNFLSIGQISLNFEELHGLIFVQGINRDINSNDTELTSNGAGKSSLFSALLFGLYGETLHDVKTQSICNKQHLNESTSVIVELYGKDGNEYKIHTIIENQTLCRIKIYKNSDVEPINSTSTRDTRKFIETTILGVSSEVFRRRVLLINDGGQDFFNLRSDKRLQLIENSFGLGVFGQIFKVVHQDFLRLQKDIGIVDQKIKGFENIIKDLKESHASFDSKKLEKNKKLQTELTEILHLLLKEVQLNDLDFKLINEKINSIATSISESKKKLGYLSEQKQKLQTLEFKIHHLFKIAASNNDRYEKVLGIICDDCKNKVVKTLINEEFEPKSAEKILLTTQSNVLTISEVTKTLQTKISENEQTQKNIVLLMQKLELVKHKLNEAQSETSPFDNLIKKNSVDLQEVERIQTENYEKYNYLNFADYAMSENGVKQFIIQDIISELNTRIQYYLVKLGATYTVKFDERFNTTFYLDGIEMELNNFSSGEKVKLKLATLFVFRDMLFSQIATAFNVLIIDEFFDSSIDNFTIQQILTILEEISLKQHCAIFIISHRDILKENISRFSSKIIIEKQNGISSLITEKLI